MSMRLTITCSAITGKFPGGPLRPGQGQAKDQGDTWEKWQVLGYDSRSVLGDSLFVDPCNGDYRVKPESPAIELGFCNFDLDAIGLLPDFPDAWQSECAYEELC